jgi:hypothetical protein
MSCAGNGTPLPSQEDGEALVQELIKGRAAANQKLLSGLKEDPNAEHMLEVCKGECQNGRMSAVVPVERLDLSAVTLSPRFSVEQLREDGTKKVRPIDDFSRSGCNSASVPTEKLAFEGLDVLLATTRALRESMGRPVRFWKSDIDSAYRRLGVSEEHRQFAWIVFVVGCVIFAAEHVGLPFGALASVHWWNRIGEYSSLAHGRAGNLFFAR